LSNFIRVLYNNFKSEESANVFYSLLELQAKNYIKLEQREIEKLGPIKLLIN